MDAKSLGTLVIFAGVVIVVIGVATATGLLTWFGRLPGDIRIEGANVRVYAPIASMLLISLVLSLVLLLTGRFR
jgi:Protein of unknown function (DUF2905)